MSPFWVAAWSYLDAPGPRPLCAHGLVLAFCCIGTCACEGAQLVHTGAFSGHLCAHCTGDFGVVESRSLTSLKLDKLQREPGAWGQT
jgi:hypothetical protein